MSALTWFRLLGLGCCVCLLVLDAGRSDDAPKAKGKKYALLIGVTEYNHAKLRPLKFTENDVEALEKELVKPAAGFSSIRLLSVSRGKKDKADAPTKANIEKALDDLFAKKGRLDTVLIALSGHGVQLKVRDPDDVKIKPKTYSYFCPTDADFEKISHDTGKAPHLILMEDVLKRLGDCGAGTRFILVDACRNELKADSTTRSLETGKIDLPPGVAALFSCKSGEEAWESPKLKHGVFFHYVLEGLRGKARNDRGEVRWSTLYDYVAERVAEDVPTIIGGGASQTPHGVQNFEGLSPILIVGDGSRHSANSLGMRLVLIPAGKFTMGSSTKERKSFIDSIGLADRRKSFTDECGQETEHTVEITKPFLIGAHEVTQKQFRAVMDNPSHFRKAGKGKDEVARLSAAEIEDLPVESVSWNQADEFCRKLSSDAAEQKAGRTYRLPTEAEWEYACRAGTKTAFHFGDELTMKQANHGFLAGEKEVPGRPTKVGSYKPNAWGLYDMHGNVWEWCSDWYDEKAYSRGNVKDPTGPTNGKHRVLRGGAWNRLDRFCRSAYRSDQIPNGRSNSIGFRVVCEAK